MTEVTIKEAFEGSCAIRFSDDGLVCVVWSGGTTYNVYTLAHDGGGPVHEVDVFSVSDKRGRPLERSDAINHMDDYLDRRD